jgi:hypothetical protein
MNIGKVVKFYYRDDNFSEYNGLGGTCDGDIVLTVGWYLTEVSWVKAWEFKWRVSGGCVSLTRSR